MTRKEKAREALSKMVDELGDLEKEIEAYKPKFARVEILRAAIRAAFGKSDPGKRYQVEGETWVVLLGKAGNSSVVDKAELLRLVGPARFAAASFLTLKSLEEHFPKDILGAVVSLEAVGPRVLTVVAKADNAAAEA